MKNNTIAILAICFATGSVNAANFSFTGNFSNDDEVQPFNFTVVGPAVDVDLRTWSWGGGTNAAGTAIPDGGFDPIISLFDASSGAKIAFNDDTSGIPESRLMQHLAAGNYIATLTQFSSFSAGPFLTDGFYGTLRTNFGSRDSHWALDVLNVNTASVGVPYVFVPPIPEPETYAMLLVGLGLLGWQSRRV